jgi:hypothetical protein
MPVLINESATYRLGHDLEIEMRRSLREAARMRYIVKHSLAFNPNETCDLGNRPTFYVVIIYEDSKAGRRAKHFYDRVIQELEDECDFSLELWSFQVLALPGIGNAAARAAAHADFVILSMYGKSQLSVQAKDWIVRWSGLIGDCKPALVALLDSGATGRVTVASTLHYLRKVADRNNISFYAHTLPVCQQTRKNSTMFSWAALAKGNDTP